MSTLERTAADTSVGAGIGGPVGAAIAAAISLAGGLLYKGRDSPGPGQRKRLIEFGYKRIAKQKWLSPDGRVLGGQRAAKIGKALNRAVRAGRIAAPVMQSAADVISSIPPQWYGRAAAAVGGVLRQIPAIAVVGGLFWPTAAGRGSDLRDFYAKNVAKPLPKGPSRRRGRRRAKVRPRKTRVLRPPLPVPARAPGPVAIQRARARPKLPAVAQMPRPRSLPRKPPVPKAGKISVSPPARIPGVGVPGAIRDILSSVPPWVRTAVGGAVLSSVVSPAVPKRFASFTPAVSPSLGAQPLAFAWPNSDPLTRFQSAAAQSPASELDRQCRERAKRKRKPKKKRTVCYRGTYTENADGTTKRKKEQIPCRASSRKKPQLRPVR